MEKEEWIKRCEVQFDKGLGAGNTFSRAHAENCFETMHEAMPNDPEGAADDQMRDWYVGYCDADF